MIHRFDIRNILRDVIGYKGLPFPGVFMKQQPDGYDGSKYDYDLRVVAEPVQEHLKNGTELFARDHLGRWYFMPVYFIAGGQTVEFPTALVSAKTQKIIIKTPMVERGGSVKELIATDDYEINLAGIIINHAGQYPEDEIAQIRALYDRNESVEMVSAITSLLLDPDDKVVIESIDFPPTPGLENGQVVKMKCITDKPFELIID